MGLLSGSVSVTRFNVRGRPSELDFEQVRFQEILPGSEVRESRGIIPFEPGAEYQVGAARWAFRVRIDRLKPDPTAVKERLRELIRGELQAGAEFVSAKRRKELRELAEEELIVASSPSTTIIEAVIDGDVLYVGSTAKANLGLVMQLLRQLGVVIEPKTPWIDRREPDFESEIVPIREPGESALGCRFLRALVGDREVVVEPESGLVRLVTEEARVTLGGAVLKELHHYLEKDAELLAAKLLVGESSFRLEAPSFRIVGLSIQTGRHEHWTEVLDERLEKLAGVWELLERKYAELRSEMI